MLSQLVSQDITGEQKINEAVDDERGVGLTRMLPAQDYHCWFVKVLFLVLIRYFDKRHVYSSV